jgi:hypothetical protein
VCVFAVCREDKEPVINKISTNAKHMMMRAFSLGLGLLGALAVFLDSLFEIPLCLSTINK